MRISALLLVLLGVISSEAAVQTSAVLPRATSEISAATEQVLLSEPERIFGLVTLYRTAREKFAWWEQVPDLDWDRAFLEYLPLVQHEESTYGYYLLLKKFMALLKDGHTEVYFPYVVQKELDRFPIEVSFYGGEWVVIRRFPTEEIREKDIPVGSLLRSIEGLSPKRYLEENVFPYLEEATLYRKRMESLQRFDFPAGTELLFEIEYPDGTIEARTLRANYAGIEWTDELEEEYGCQCPEISFKRHRMEGDIDYVWFGDCEEEVLEEFAGYIRSVSSEPPPGLILDLRYNGGGQLIVSASAVGYLIGEPIKTWSRWTRCAIATLDDQFDPSEGVPYWNTSSWLESDMGVLGPAGGVLPNQFREGWIPLANPPEEWAPPNPGSYTGPLVVLTGYRTASAAEDLAALLRGSGRAPIVGEMTAGTTGYQSYAVLPGGGRARVCDVQHHYPGAGDYVGSGLIPDVPVLRTLEGIREGRDEILEAAVEYLKNPEAIRSTVPSPNASGLFTDLIRALANE
jgi:hypothetical protein